MSESISWYLGKEGATSTRMDIGPFRAYFIWTSDGIFVRSADFNAAELQSEIQRLASVGEHIDSFAAALKRLERI